MIIQEETSLPVCTECHVIEAKCEGLCSVCFYGDNTGTACNYGECQVPDCKNYVSKTDTAVNQAKPVTVKRQYYYQVNGCPAESPDSKDCVCWHDEGSGPYPDGYWYDSDNERRSLEWREVE
jgi:hypothetical protein